MTAVIFLILRICLAAALYAFLFTVLRTLWHEVNMQGVKLANQKKATLQISTTLVDGTQKKQKFHQDDITIGRAPSCTISLNDEALSVNHARLAYHHAQWWIEDLGSTNGTFLGMERINTPTVIIDGDEFRCGNTRFVVKINSISKSGG